ncbi:MAG TPA: hypothetical protein VJ718_07920, partial [Candidatus Binataceae bacterium]|nr:hypothetical protein [Candidatus Binataceae bacterium]
MQTRRCWRLFGRILWLAALAAIAGCSRGPRAPAQTLYVAVPETAQIAIYPVSASGDQRPSETIRETPPDKPVDVSVDAAHEIFVANENGNV